MSTLNAVPVVIENDVIVAETAGYEGTVVDLSVLGAEDIRAALLCTLVRETIYRSAQRATRASSGAVCGSGARQTMPMGRTNGLASDPDREVPRREDRQRDALDACFDEDLGSVRCRGTHPFSSPLICAAVAMGVADHVSPIS